MAANKIHLIAPAGSSKAFLKQLAVLSTAGLIDRVSDILGPSYTVTANEAIIEATEQESLGGRTDDAERARDIQEALSDSNVAAMVMIRGGAWFTRILPHIDFSVLDDRSTPIAVFGFSELTTLVGIVAAHPMGVGVYDMGPAFLPYGLRKHAVSIVERGEALPAVASHPLANMPGSWARARLPDEFESYFHDVRSMIEGLGTTRSIEATLVAGQLDDRTISRMVGGNLTVMSSVFGSRFEKAFKPRGGWLFVEDFNDKIERIDRFLAHLSLTQLWDECAGLLLGNFHQGEEDQQEAVLALLRYHMPANRILPILSCRTLGHVWPMSPLALHVPVEISQVGQRSYTLAWRPENLQTILNH